MEEVLEHSTQQIAAEGRPAQAGRRRVHLRYHRWLVKNIPFYLFAAGLAVFYIANGHYADKMIRATSLLEKKVKEMEYEYKIVKRDVMFRSKQSELARVVAPLGLEELKEPPLIIKDTIR